MRLCPSLSRQVVDSLVSCQWLANRLSQRSGTLKSLKLLHCARANLDGFQKAHIPTALKCELSKAVLPGSPCPNTLPQAEQFSRYVGEVLGIHPDDHVVVYDASANYPSLEVAARIWFTFRYFNHQNVSVLSGGLLDWMATKLPVTRESHTTTSAVYEVKQKPMESLTKSFDDVMANLQSKKFQMLDARPEHTFESGHIPAAINVPLIALIDLETKLVRSREDLREVFTRSGVNLDGELVAYCNSGVTACAIVLALNSVGKTDCQLYDGSWSEWAKRADPKYIERD